MNALKHADAVLLFLLHHSGLSVPLVLVWYFPVAGRNFSRDPGIQDPMKSLKLQRSCLSISRPNLFCIIPSFRCQSKYWAELHANLGNQTSPPHPHKC